MIALMIKALTKPADLTASDAWLVEKNLAQGARPQALAAVLALLYSRSDLVSDGMVRLIRELVLKDQQGSGALQQVLTAMLFTSHARDVPSIAFEALERCTAVADLRARYLAVLRDCVQWRPELMEHPRLIQLLESTDDPGELNFVGDYLIDRLVFATPFGFNPSELKRIVAQRRGTPRFRYFLAFLRECESAEIQAIAQHEAGPWFPHAEEAAAILGGGRFRALVFVNSLFGQGDEIVRAAPLVDGILNGNPCALVTMVSRRTFLTDHPRVSCVPLADDEAVREALKVDYDAVLHFHEPRWPNFNRRPELADTVARCIERVNPPLLIEGGHGDATFTFQKFRLNGKELAPELALDRELLENIYDPGVRLLAELGLPVVSSRPSAMLAGWGLDAARLWDEMVPDATRKTALVNPFGGTYPCKGYTYAHFSQLTAELEGLIREGFHVVFLPNGTFWGRRAEVDAVLSGLPPHLKPHVSIAPDPGDPGTSVQFGFTERQELDTADRTMRLFRHFAARADLVVTVEGWMSHLAFALGRPFRLILMAESAPHRWHPLARGPAQTLETGMSPLARIDTARTDLLVGDPQDLLPRRHRKDMLLPILRALGESGSAGAVPLLRHATESPDGDLRKAAGSAIGPPASHSFKRGALRIVSRLRGFRRKASDSGSLTILTGADSVYFPALKNLVGSVHFWEPGTTVILFNLGLSKRELDEIALWRNCEIRWKKGPPGKLRVRGRWRSCPHLRDLKKYAWKPAAIVEGVERCSAVLWLDAGSDLRGDLAPVHEILLREGYFLVQGQDLDMTAKLHDECARRLGLRKQDFVGLPSFAGNTQGYLRGAEATKEILLPMYEAAAEPECIAPDGAHLLNHRFDQSILSLIAHRGPLQVSEHTALISANREELEPDPTQPSARRIFTARGESTDYVRFLNRG